MKFINKIITVFALGILVSSCSTILPVTATNNAIGSKVGTSKSTILFGTANRGNLGAGLVLNKDYGVIDAVKKADIKSVATVDLKVTNYYIFTKAELIVTGE